MRRAVPIVAILLATTAASAADTTQLSLFTSNLGAVHSSGYTRYTGGAGIALAHAFTTRWSAELRVAAEQHWKDVTAAIPATPYIPVPMRVKFRVYPIDLLAKYSFPNQSRWTPYVSGGVRYVNTPAIHRADLCVGMPDSPCSQWTSVPFQRASNPVSDRFDAQLGIGTNVRITPRFGLCFDANALLRSDDVSYDPLVRPSFGVNWRF
ncbi:MAG TPA: hypothetical protein VLU46_05235 [Thermoanaerobaculia bacterium]|nr:hypothetical protein [Thermoanaerobaculia bacterium]